MFRHLMMVVACVSVAGLVARCGLADLAGTKDKDKKDGTTTSEGPCFIAPALSTLEPGGSTTATAATGFEWTGVSSLQVDGQTITSESAPITLAPKASRTYAVVKRNADGTAESCTFAIEVTGTTAADLACSIVSDPASLATGDIVNVTLQVSGTVPAVSTSINGEDLGSAAGGTKQLSVFFTNSIVGRVEAADGQVSECVVDVVVGGSTTSGEYCKAEATAVDFAALDAKTAAYKTENDTARDAAVAAAVTARNLTDLAGVKTVELGEHESLQVVETKLCEKIIASSGATGACTIGNYTDTTYAATVRVAIGSASFDVVIYETDADAVLIKTLPGGDAVAIAPIPNIEYAEKVPFEYCKCDNGFDSGGVSSEDDASDASAPATKKTAVYYPTVAGMTFPANVNSVAYKFKSAQFEYKEVPPAAGQKAPQCSYEPAT